MSDYDRNAGLRWGVSVGRDRATEIDQGLHSYMLGVYNYMTLGLGVTGLVAWRQDADDHDDSRGQNGADAAWPDLVPVAGEVAGDAGPWRSYSSSRSTSIACPRRRATCSSLSRR